MRRVSSIFLFIAGFGVLFLTPTWASEKLRVFVTGTNAQAETIQHLNKRCPELAVTMDSNKADYTIRHDNTRAGMGRNPHKIAVFNRDGDAIYSGSTKTVGGAVKDACKSIRQDIKKNKPATEQGEQGKPSAAKAGAKKAAQCQG